MATRGVRPKPAMLRAVDGTHRTTRHGDAAQAIESAQESAHDFGPLKRPSYLTGEARKCWDAQIVPARWLDASRFVSAVVFCELWKEWRSDHKGFPAAKHNQMRAYQSELGLTDERNRTRNDGQKEADPAARYF